MSAKNFLDNFKTSDSNTDQALDSEKTDGLATDLVNENLDAGQMDQQETQPAKSRLGGDQSNFKAFLQKHRRKLLISAGVVILALLLLTTATVYAANTASRLRFQAEETMFKANQAMDHFRNQDLVATRLSLLETQDALGVLEESYSRLSFVSNLPFAGPYYQDGAQGLIAATHGLNAGIKTIEALEPYADVLGFGGASEDEEEEAVDETAENRIKLILQGLEFIAPELDEVEAELTKANQALSQIDANRYPETLRGVMIRSRIIAGKNYLDQAQTALADYRPIIEYLPAIAGAGEDGRKKYLVLFQNDNELRPTGGFLTAYSVIYIEDGVVTPEKSDDIYELDKKWRTRIPIPDRLGRYLTTERYFNLRDMNISPDFQESMELFFEHYQTVPGEPDNIDGIIAVDTQLLTDLLRAVGPVEVPGYGTFSAENDPRCDCPQIIYVLSEIITRPTPYIREDRKGILAPLMQAILQKVYSAPRTYMADLFEVGVNSLNGRHLQAYLFDETHQKAIKTINAGGHLVNRSNSPDFLAIVNANLGGAKSNLFVHYDVKQVIDGPENGQITKTVEITYRNPRRADNCNLEAGLLCLNSTLRDWTRIYVPEGSELISAAGFTEEPRVYDEAGFSVFDGFFILEPLGTARLVLTYTVPYGADEYDLTIWKQGGISPVEHLIDVNGDQDMVLLDRDIRFTNRF